MSVVIWVCLAVLLVGCAKPEASVPPPLPASPTAPLPASPTPPSPASVGTATMAPDGTITLHLVTNDNGMHGEAMRSYARTDKDYDAVLKHLGGLAPGESKPIPPWDN